MSKEGSLPTSGEQRAERQSGAAEAADKLSVRAAKDI